MSVIRRTIPSRRTVAAALLLVTLAIVSRPPDAGPSPVPAVPEPGQAGAAAELISGHEGPLRLEDTPAVAPHAWEWFADGSRADPGDTLAYVLNPTPGDSLANASPDFSPTFAVAPTPAVTYVAAPRPAAPDLPDSFRAQDPPPVVEKPAAPLPVAPIAAAPAPSPAPSPVAAPAPSPVAAPAPSPVAAPAPSPVAAPAGAGNSQPAGGLLPGQPPPPPLPVIGVEGELGGGSGATTTVPVTVTISAGAFTNEASPVLQADKSPMSIGNGAVGIPLGSWVAADGRGSGAGWNVTLTANDFANSGGALPVAGIKVALAQADIVTLGGEGVPITGAATAVPVSRRTPFKLIHAAGLSGAGRFSYSPSLVLSAFAGRGTYAASFTVSINSGP